MYFAIISLATLLILTPPCTAQVPSGQPGTFEDYALLELSSQAGRALFRECKLTVLLPTGGGPGASRLDCIRNTKDAQRVEAAHRFTAEQTTDLRLRLRAATLFGTGHIGTDTRESDGGLVILTVSDSGATVAIVVSGNPTFSNPGPRKDFSDWLMAHQADLIESWSHERDQQ